MEFQHLALDSIQHNSKAESLNNRSAQQPSVGTLILKQNLWSLKNAAKSFTVALTLTLGGYESAIAPFSLIWHEVHKWSITQFSCTIHSYICITMITSMMYNFLYNNKVSQFFFLRLRGMFEKWAWLFWQNSRVSKNPHEKINRCLTNINRYL